MQKEIDFLVFIISNLVIFFWCMLVFKNKRQKYLFLNLNKVQFIILFIIEVVLFYIMYFNFETHKSVDVSDSFAWHYSIIYARGILPLVVLSNISDNFFAVKDPIILCLVFGLIMDYFILFVCSKFADVRNKKIKIQLDSKKE